MPKYTTPDELAKYLGRTFDDNEHMIADLAIEAAEEIIDGKSRIRFKEVGPQTLTVYAPPSPLVMLPGVGPFSAISIIGYSTFGSTGFPLVAGTHYEIRNAVSGQIWFPNPADFYRLDIVYTPSPAVPSRVKLATNIMAAHWMRPILNDEVPGLANYSVGAEFSIAFNTFVQEKGYPPEVDTLIGIPSLYIA
jgi:hypothetical protein